MGGGEEGRQLSMKPTVGRIVHYYPHPANEQGDGPLAAIITGLTGSEHIVHLRVFSVAGDSFPAFAAPMAEEPTAGCWTWPPRA